MSYKGLISGRSIIGFDGNDVSSLHMSRSGAFPVKVYVFKSFNEHIGSSGEDVWYLSEMLRNHPEIANGHECAVAQAFGFRQGEEPVKGLDIFSLRLVDGDWDNNPMWDEWSYENGVYVPKEKGVCCGAGMVIMGREEELRAGCKDLKEYMGKWPEIGSLLVPPVY